MSKDNISEILNVHDLSAYVIIYSTISSEPTMLLYICSEYIFTVLMFTYHIQIKE